MRRALRGHGFATFCILLGAALLLLAAVFFPLWKPLLLALVIAGALRSLQERLARRFRGHRSLAAGVLVLGFLIIVLIPLAGIVSFAVREGIAGVNWIQDTLQREGPQGFVALVPSGLQPYASKLIHDFPDSAGELAKRVPSQGMAAASALGQVLSATGNIFFQTAMLLIALFFLLADGPRLGHWLRAVSPLGGRATTQLMDEMRGTASSVLVSTTVTAAVQATIAGLGYWIARVPHPVFFASVTFFAAFIPSVGTSIVALPIAAVLLLTGHIGGGIFLAAWSLLVTGTIDNVLKPILVRGGTEIHGGLVFFSMIGGIVLFGALGLVLGPVSLSLILTLVKLGRREYAERVTNTDAEPTRFGAEDESGPPMHHA